MILQTKQQTQEITALYMGQTDLETGLWLPIQKMTWDYIDQRSPASPAFARVN
jgi:hypothetical protein